MRTFETKIRLKMCHIQRKTVITLTILLGYLELAPPCQKKNKNWLTFPPPLVRKKSEIDKPALSPCQKKSDIG